MTKTTFFNKNVYRLKYLQKLFFLIVCLFSFIYTVNAQTNSTFDAGDRVDVYFAPTSLAPDGITQLSTIYHGFATGNTVTSNGNDFFTIADNTTTAPLTTTTLPSMTSSNNTVSPFLGLDDVVVFRNAGSEGGVSYDVVIKVISVVDFVDGSVDTGMSGEYVYPTASLSRYLQPNTSGNNTISFSTAANNFFDDGASGGVAATAYNVGLNVRFFENESYDFGLDSGNLVTLSPVLEISDIDFYTSQSSTSGLASTPVDEVVTTDLSQFSAAYLMPDSFLILSGSVEVEVNPDELTSPNPDLSSPVLVPNPDPVIFNVIDNSGNLTVRSTAGDNTPQFSPRIVVANDEHTIRLDAEAITDFDFTLGSDTGHKGPNFQLKARSNPDLQISDGLIIIPGDTDKDNVLDLIDLDDDNDGILDADETPGFDPDGDADGDGVLNYFDVNDAGTTGDGSTTDYTDSNGDGIADVFDTDLDGIPNHLDLDSDNDTIPDNIEAQTTAGYIAPTATDTDGDGLDDAYDTDCIAIGNPAGCAAAGVAITPVDTDGNTTEDLPDFLDLDSDDDGNLDIDEVDNGTLDTDCLLYTSDAADD